MPFFVLLCGNSQLGNLIMVEPYLTIKVEPYIYFHFAIDKVFCCLQAIIRRMKNTIYQKYDINL